MRQPGPGERSVSFLKVLQNKVDGSLWEPGAGTRREPLRQVCMRSEWKEQYVGNPTRRLLVTLRRVMVGSVTGMKEEEVCSLQGDIIIYFLLKTDNNS